MSDQIKKLAPLIWQQIQSAQEILLHCHPNPDPDSVGSALSLKHALHDMGKKVTIIIGDSSPPGTLSHLPGFTEIENINYFQLDKTKFDLFIILDSSSPGQISQLGEVKFPANLHTIIIDHHSTNTKYAEINLVETTYPAVGQILYDLFRIWDIKITRDMATCLFLAIYTDTGGFKYPLTTKDTLLAAAELAGINPEYTQDIFWLENSFEPQHISYMALALTNLEFYFSGKVVISAVAYHELEKRGIQKTHTEKIEIANTLKSVIGWEIGLSLIEKEPGKVGVSLRTRDAEKFNVAKIAFATGSGGGHPSAAGATIKKPFSEAKELLLNTIQSIYPDLGQP